MSARLVPPPDSLPSANYGLDCPVVTLELVVTSTGSINQASLLRGSSSIYNLSFAAGERQGPDTHCQEFGVCVCVRG